MENQSFWDKFMGKKFVRIIKIITESATFALFLSVIFFSVGLFNNMKESKELTDNLMKIQSSLSTRYLGEFPDFLPEITQLYTEAEDVDSIVIMEDVLFYGINSNPEQFYKSNAKLLEYAANGVSILIVYYKPNGLAYNLMINEWLLSPECYKEYRDALMLFNKRNLQFKERKKLLIDTCVANNLPKEETDRRIQSLMEKCFEDIVDPKYVAMQKERMSKASYNANKGIETIKDDNEIIRAILQEQYFAETCDANKKAFESRIKKYRKMMAQSLKAETADTRAEIEMRQVFSKMDSVRLKNVGDARIPVESITFADIKNMYTEMSMVMEETFSKYPNISLVPVNEFLSVRSWLVMSSNNRNQAIMAFPSRYDSSEIGFFTTDATTTEYVLTMRQGILVNYGQ